MKTINIKGKEYIPVNERLKEFWKLYPTWSLVTDRDEAWLAEDEVVIKAMVYDETGKLRATGYAHEEKQGSMINRTSFIENCETSAIGRALGNLGIGIDTSIASADELQHAVDRQAQLEKKVTAKEIGTLKMVCESKGSDFNMLLSYYNLEKAEDMKYAQFLDAMKILEKK